VKNFKLIPFVEIYLRTTKENGKIDKKMKEQASILKTTV
jgi:hypothetical protein